MTSQSDQAGTTTSAPDHGARIAIVGGGASGTLTALNLLRDRSAKLHVTLFETTGLAGVGVAYGTPDGRHLLNVRAGNMSAFPDVPSDLVEWAAATGRELAPTDFLPRKDYALYLRDRLAEVTDERLTVVAQRVVDVSPEGSGYLVHTADGAVTEADEVVLAYGNQPPHGLSVHGVPLPEASWHVPNPWRLDWVDTLAADATIVLVGTGLTAIDTAITWLEDGPKRRVVMVSRHGLLPKPHIDEQSVAWVTQVPDGPLTADGISELFIENVRNAAGNGVDWRQVVDGLRAPTQSIWARLSEPERRRFLAKHARHWEIRRHRMAPEIAARLARYQSTGRLSVVGGGVTAVTNDGDRALVEVGGEVITADAVVNCTGPQTDITRVDNPLLAALLQRGLIAPDALRLGLATTPAGEILDARGDVVPGLFTVGPPRKGVLYETTAVPEIRVQAAEIAANLLTR